MVVGGGAGGIGAALGAARLGARVLLVERYGFLGGAATNAQVLSYCGFHAAGPTPREVVAGVGRQVLDGLATLGYDVAPVRSKSGNWIVMIDPEAVKVTLDRARRRARRVALMLHTRLVGRRARHRAAARRDARGPRRACTRSAADAFVDASGEADLAACAGVPMSQPGGPGAHVQPASLPVRIGGVAANAVLDRARLTALVGEYNATARVPLARADGGVLTRVPGSSDWWWMTIDVATDGLHGEDLAARRGGRTCAGMGHAGDAASPSRLRTGGASSRRARSSASANRAARARCATRRRTTRGTVRAATTPSRAPGGRWKCTTRPGRTRFVPLGGEGFFDVGYGALCVPDVANLRLAGRVIGADADAYGSVRVMGTAFATGQAAGVGAALHASGGTAIGAAGESVTRASDADRVTSRADHVAAVRAALRAQDALI